ncbi:glycoside hydrolase family 9 protein [Cylindrobasidium torrendii FP15055 ss-10]|uniref:Endoglucanase n=1 Tax=Cylindrobasidium torrendii FP15055 ss-10 TaxID=1314674 RepID=A0A0D7BU38_9AGAR|nr:glycoside hydrolase family 9 protein [Cylindrobasidium torrendii FP15055 ss-10]
MSPSVQGVCTKNPSREGLRVMARSKNWTGDHRIRTQCSGSVGRQPWALAQVSLPTEPWLPADNTDATFANLLGHLVYFYDAQRTGKLPASNRVSWRNDSCLEDGKEDGVDLSGGFFDAGDYIKATFPMSFAIMSICWGATDFGHGYDLANQTAYLDGVLRWGLDWLMKAHDSDNSLYVLVANAGLNNDYWGGDENIPTPRPTFQVNATNPGTDVVAGVSAAFSACSSLYNGQSFGGPYSNPASLKNTTYAKTLLSHSEKLYTFAVNASGGQALYQESVPEVGSSYPSSSYEDELTIAALFLARASNSTTLFNEAIGDFDKYKLRNSDAVFNWDSKTPGIAVLFAQMTCANSTDQLGGDFEQWRDAAEDYFDDVISHQGKTDGGLAYWEGDSQSASLNPALNVAMLLARYAPLASSDDKRQKYEEYAKGQLDYVLGKNPMNVPYVVGVNSNSPSNPHSAPASGGDDVGAIDTSPAEEAYVLYGATVGGPDRWDDFYDIRSDWPQTEVALDYNAPLLTLAAMYVLKDGSDPYYAALKEGARITPKGSPCDEAITTGCKAGSLPSTGKIVVGVVVSAVGAFIVGLGCYYVWLVTTVQTA